MASKPRKQGKPKVAERQTLKPSGELTINTAADLLPQFSADPGPDEIDLSAVTELDSAGLQLLMLAKKLAAAQGRELHLVAHSAPVIEVFELLNVAAHFGDPLVLPARADA